MFKLDTLVNSELLAVSVLIYPVNSQHFTWEYSAPNVCQTEEWVGEYVREWPSHIPVCVSSPISHSG